MIRSGKALALLVLGVAVCCSSEGYGSNPFQTIVDRNVFGLNPPPPPGPSPEERNKPPPPTIYLNGITTMLGKKRVFMTLQLPAKPPEPAKAESLMLCENERDGEVEVISIDPVEGSVKVNDYGTITNLTFEKNAPKAAPTTAAAHPGMPGHPGGVMAPGFHSPFGAKSIPTRTLRLPSISNRGGLGSAQTANPTMNEVASAAPVSASPGSPFVYNSNHPNQQTAPQQQTQPPLSNDAYALLLEAQREATKQDVLNGTSPPLPTTRYTPQDAVGQLQNEQPNPGQQAPTFPRGF